MPETKLAGYDPKRIAQGLQILAKKIYNTAKPKADTFNYCNSWGSFMASLADSMSITSANKEIIVYVKMFVAALEQRYDRVELCICKGDLYCLWKQLLINTQTACPYNNWIKQDIVAASEQEFIKQDLLDIYQLFSFIYTKNYFARLGDLISAPFSQNPTLKGLSLQYQGLLEELQFKEVPNLKNIMKHFEDNASKMNDGHYPGIAFPKLTQLKDSAKLEMWRFFLNLNFIYPNFIFCIICFLDKNALINELSINILLKEFTDLAHSDLFSDCVELENISLLANMGRVLTLLEKVRAISPNNLPQLKYSLKRLSRLFIYQDKYQLFSILRCLIAVIKSRQEYQITDDIVVKYAKKFADEFLSIEDMHFEQEDKLKSEQNSIKIQYELLIQKEKSQQLSNLENIKICFTHAAPMIDAGLIYKVTPYLPLLMQLQDQEKFKMWDFFLKLNSTYTHFIDNIIRAASNARLTSALSTNALVDAFTYIVESKLSAYFIDDENYDDLALSAASKLMLLDKLNVLTPNDRLELKRPLKRLCNLYLNGNFLLIGNIRIIVMLVENCHQGFVLNEELIKNYANEKSIDEPSILKDQNFNQEDNVKQEQNLQQISIQLDQDEPKVPSVRYYGPNWLKKQRKYYSAQSKKNDLIKLEPILEQTSEQILEQNSERLDQRSDQRTEQKSEQKSIQIPIQQIQPAESDDTMIFFDQNWQAEEQLAPNTDKLKISDDSLQLYQDKQQHSKKDCKIF